MKSPSPRKKIEQIAEKFQLDIIYAFGSNSREVVKYINGYITAIKIPLDSDIDIGVKPRPSKALSIKEKVQLSIEFEDLLRVNRIDLIVLPESDPFLAANIIRGERLYCTDEYVADEYDLYVLRRAGDLAPLEKERIALILGG